MRELLEYLASNQTGSNLNAATLESLLAACWDEFAGSEAFGMTGEKLLNRTENLRWNPPLITFMIERHAGTVHGSSRADLHGWEINVETGTASSSNAGRRQLKSMQAKVDVRPVAEEIGALMIAGQNDERLHWNENGSVRVDMGKIYPPMSAVKQTLAGRRKRFRERLEEILSIAGWLKVRPNVYMRNNLC